MNTLDHNLAVLTSRERGIIEEPPHFPLNDLAPDITGDLLAWAQGMDDHAHRYEDA